MDAGQASPAVDSLAWPAEGVANGLGQVDVHEPDSQRSRWIVAQDCREEHRVLGPEVDDRDPEEPLPPRQRLGGIRGRLTTEGLVAGQRSHLDDAGAVGRPHRWCDARDR